MQSEGDFRLGFCFALLVARTMGFGADPSAVYNQLRSIARGELTLMPSPEDALHDAQAQLGRPLTEQERVLFQTCIPTNRAEQDTRNLELACLLLRLMGRET